MLIISRDHASKASRAELHSALHRLFNTLSHKTDDATRQCCHASIAHARAGLNVPRR